MNWFLFGGYTPFVRKPASKFLNVRDRCGEERWEVKHNHHIPGFTMNCMVTHLPPSALLNQWPKDVSRSWVKCVVFGGREKIMSSSLASLSTTVTLLYCPCILLLLISFLPNCSMKIIGSIYWLSEKIQVRLHTPLMSVFNDMTNIILCMKHNCNCIVVRYWGQGIQGISKPKSSGLYRPSANKSAATGLRACNSHRSYRYLEYAPALATGQPAYINEL